MANKRRVLFLKNYIILAFPVMKIKIWRTKPNMWVQWEMGSPSINIALFDCANDQNFIDI